MRITIGRDRNNDLCVPPFYETVSNRHADLEEIGGRLYIIDHSTNGTIINGHRVTNTREEIKYGDNIKLSNAYTLSWENILKFFPDFQSASVSQSRNISNEPGGRMTQMHNVSSMQLIDHAAMQNPENQKYEIEKEVVKKGWNWGAFLLGWIWGVGHRCWWPLLVCLCFGLFITLLSIVAPIAATVICGLYNILLLAMSIYLGVKGNEIGWNNECYYNIEHFHRKERQWTIAGLIVWGLYLLAIIYIFVFAFSIVASLM